VRDFARLHDAAGVVATSDQVRSGDAKVRAMGASGQAVVPVVRVGPAQGKPPSARTPRRRPVPHRSRPQRDVGRQRSRSAS
jgi:hypothetical protein